MHKNRLLMLASLAVCSPSLLSAALPAEEIEAMVFGGFHLGMTATEAESMMRNRNDLGEAAASWDRANSFDCDDLYPNSTKDKYDPEHQPNTLTGYYFEDIAHSQYSVSFSPLPSGAAAVRVTYGERRGIGAWPSYLVEAEARFGKADIINKDINGTLQAAWCTPGEQNCGSLYNVGPQLTLSFYPHEDGQLEAGDRLDFEIDEGSAAAEQREEFYATLAARNPVQARALYRQCRSSAGKYVDQEAFERHSASLLSLGSDAKPPVFKPYEVPRAIYAALGIDFRSTFAPGICFAANDVILESPECQQYSPIRFKWARKVGDMWVVALQMGGISLRREYLAVRLVRNQQYKKIWWSDSIAGFPKWRANGSHPMLPEPVE
jgi:hypothetical protein